MSIATKMVHLHIAEMVVSEEPLVINTVLGSCVAVVIYSPEKKVGGMIHFALPSVKDAGTSSDALRFGDQAVEKLAHAVLKLAGGKISQLRAKIAGGAAVVDSLKQSANIGELNIQMAEKCLRILQIPLLGKDVGGTQGRKVLFYTDTGRLRSAFVESQKGKVFEAPIMPGFDATGKPQSRKKKVLIIDDSKTICTLLTRILSEDSDLEVVATAPNPVNAIELVKKHRPDVITLDIHMPEMTGIEFLEKLYPSIQVPVVMITSISKEDGNAVFRALELGAVDYIQKPKMEELKEVAPLICEKVKMAASIRIKAKNPAKSAVPVRRIPPRSGNISKNILVAIGASTGGTEALKEVLIRLPKEIPPILIVQHIPPVFSTAFAKRLNDLCAFEVKEAVDGDLVLPERVLIAPGGYHMRLKRSPRGDFVTLDQLPPVQRHRPSVDVMFQSVAKEMGAKAVGVILTGMGSDGAEGMLEMKKAGARTIAQDEESCVVFGMPKEAIKLGGVDHIVSLFDVPEKILALLEVKKIA
jgi:two-component system, chemotaxis family, protein-glutamate methylesterase/glutaminase